MKYLLLLLLSVPTFANGILIEDTVVKYSDRLPETLFESMSDLSEYYKIDGIPGDSKQSIKLLGITLIDMIQSKVRESQTQRANALTNIDLLLVLKPLPKKVDLPKQYFPRFILQCSTFEKEGKFALDCRQTNPERSFGVDKFDMTLMIQKNPNPKKKEATQIKIKYSVVINKADFKQIKDKSFDLMGTSGIVKLIGNLFADPRLFFKTYWEGFYDLWINS